jgi:dihydrolipoamide dehydrogenase
VRISARPTGVQVDDQLRTTLPHVYAIVDAIGGWMFTHVSTYEAPIAVANMLDGAGIRPEYRVIPRAIFTDPELAGVGLSEEQALAAGLEVETRRYDVGKTGKSRALGDRLRESGQKTLGD